MPWAQPLAACFGADVQTISVADGDDETERLRLHVAELLGTDADDERIHVVVGGDPPAEIGDCPPSWAPAWCACPPVGGAASAVPPWGQWPGR
jgi:hypothetical protein